jgi:hypothetical protein
MKRTAAGPTSGNDDESRVSRVETVGAVLRRNGFGALFRTWSSRLRLRRRIVPLELVMVAKRLRPIRSGVCAFGHFRNVEALVDGRMHGRLRVDVPNFHLPIVVGDHALQPAPLW